MPRKTTSRELSATITSWKSIMIQPKNLLRHCQLLSTTFRLKGDMIPDFRLIDYLAGLLSTDQSPALNGELGNAQRLLKDLEDLGTFDSRMPLYLLYRLREFSKMGFSGFEGRYYSIFESLMEDMGMAVGLQTLLNAIAYKYILLGEITHQDIPDSSFIESERRGSVVDIYEIEGAYNSCNPAAVIQLISPHSKNKRVVSIMDTDVERGTRVGLVAMIEVVALMIGDIVQCYSDFYYDSPKAVTSRMFLNKGQPKSLFKPRSSTILLIFQKNRITFAEDLLQNMYRKDACSRFSKAFHIPLVETDLDVRSEIATALF